MHQEIGYTRKLKHLGLQASFEIPEIMFPQNADHHKTGAIRQNDKHRVATPSGKPHKVCSRWTPIAQAKGWHTG